MSNDKFKNMTYEEGIKKLNELISSLESGKLSFDETIVKYKEAFEYYTFCSEYLKEAEVKIRAINDNISAVSPLED